MSNRELKALIKTLRSQGVVSYEANGIKLLLDPNYRLEQRPKRGTKYNKISQTNDLQEQIDGLVPQLTDEQWLLATNSLDPEALEQ